MKPLMNGGIQSGGGAEEKQVPCGNDRKKSKNNGNGRSFPFGKLRAGWQLKKR
ncbi:MAG: hypothetical protein M3R43_00885 [Acidobacteriota bacterium]|nr:hypothetical protein [Acidobacteriota bacterium]